MHRAAAITDRWRKVTRANPPTDDGSTQPLISDHRRPRGGWSRRSNPRAGLLCVGPFDYDCCTHLDEHARRCSGTHGRFPVGFAANGRWQAKPRGHLAGVQHRGRRSPGSRCQRTTCRPAGRWSRAARHPVSAVGCREEGRELSEPAEGRSAQPMLHAGRSADHVHGFPVSDLPDAPGRRHDVRVVAGSTG